MAGISRNSGGSMTVRFAELAEGDIPLLLGPEDPAVELMRCLRYYETSYNTGVAPGTATYDGATNSGTLSETVPAGGAAGSPNRVEFTVPKRIVPTVTFYSRTGVANAVMDNATGMTVTGTYGGAVFQKSFFLRLESISDTINMQGFEYQWVADAEI
jgi:hypothetical protein